MPAEDLNNGQVCWSERQGNCHLNVNSGLMRLAPSGLRISGLNLIIQLDKIVCTRGQTRSKYLTTKQLAKQPEKIIAMISYVFSTKLIN